MIRWFIVRFLILTNVVALFGTAVFIGLWSWEHRGDPPIICWKKDGSHRNCTIRDTIEKADRLK